MTRVREFTPLCYLAKKFETDKGGAHSVYGGHHDYPICHEYTPIYWDMFHEKTGSVRKVLEIGIGYTGGSCRMWHEFFPNAQVWGIDIDVASLAEAASRGGFPRCHWVRADQSVPADLLGVVRASGLDHFDFIVDDGSHNHDHIRTSLQTLLPFLAADGVYVVEDMDPMCQHERDFGPLVPAGFAWQDVSTFDPGLGMAGVCRDGCGATLENLIVVRRGGGGIQGT